MLELLYSALASEHGIRVTTSHFTNLRAKLYALRAKHEEFSCLSFVQSPFSPNELWILKTRKDSPDGS